MIKRKDIQFGEVYMLRAGMMHGHTGWADGRVRVVSLLVDNTDNCPVPYYEAVVRFVDPTHEGYRDLKLCGPQIDYHLWRINERCEAFYWQYRCQHNDGHEGEHKTVGDDGTVYRF